MTPRDVSDRILVLTTEHSACRSEILQLSTKQQQVLIASFAVTAYAFTTLILESKMQPTLLPHEWFVLALVLSALNLMFVDCDRAIIRCATYIEGFLKVEITRLLIGPRQGATTEARDYFNSTIDMSRNPTPHELYEVREVQEIIRDREKRRPEDCRLVEWESYIRGSGDPYAGYLRGHLPDFEFHPSKMAVQASLILWPAIACFAFFVWFSYKAQFGGVLVLVAMFEAVIGIFCLGYNINRTYIVPRRIERNFPPGKRP